MSLRRRDQAMEAEAASHSTRTTKTLTTQTTTTTLKTTTRRRSRVRPRSADLLGSSPSSKGLTSWKAEQEHFLAASSNSRLDGHGSRSVNSSDESDLKGYEDLVQAPLQWADDDEKSVPASRSIEYNIKEPVSTIAFPTSPDLSSSAPSSSSSVSSSSTSNSTVKTTPPASSFASPTSRPSSRLPPRSLDKFQTIGRRAGMQQQQLRQHQYQHQGHQRHTSLPHWPAQADGHRRLSVGQSSPLVDNVEVIDVDESNTATETPSHCTDETVTMSFRQRSMQSLRGIAAAWVPSVASQSPRATAAELEPGLDGDREPVRKRHARLDRRRIDKAVSLAVEAAQASEEDEAAWRRKRESARQQSLSTSTAANGLELRLEGDESAPVRQARSRAGLSSRFASLPWRGGSPQVAERALVPFREVKSAAATPDSMSSAGEEKQGESRSGSSDDDDNDKDDDDDDGFSMDLYISSLSYLLSALSPKEANAVSPRHRQELKRKLEEALAVLDEGDGSKTAAAEKPEDWLRQELERDLALARLQLDDQQQQQRQRHGQSQTQSEQMQFLGVETWDERAHAAAQATRSKPRSRTTTIAGYIGSSALELGLSIGAGALATAAKSVESFVPAVAAGKASEPMSEEVARPSPRQAPTPSLLTNKQWEITMTLAGSAASSLYASLSAVAEQKKEPSVGTDIVDPNTPEDRLMILSASLARSIKRSPLPSQAAALAGQLGSLVAALDERYSLRKRTADVALRRTGEALGFVRKHDLHVKALRVTWAMAEAGIAAMEAYRDEDPWSPPPPESSAKRIEAAGSNT